MAFNWTNSNKIQDACALLVNNEFLADVRFQFNDGPSIFAHSFILSLRSQKFYDTFHGTVGMMKFIQIDNFSHGTFSEFLKYLYTDTIDLTPNNVVEMMKLSMEYKVQILSTEDTNNSNDDIMEDMTIYNACETLQLAIKRESREIQQFTQEFISDNYLAVMNSKSFLEINEQTLKIILELDPVSDVNEFKIFESVMKWTMHACDKDRVTPSGEILRIKLGENLKLIRFGAMSFEELIKCQEIAPELLSDTEIAAIFLNIGTKKHNKLGFLDNQRRAKDRRVSELIHKEEIELHFAPSFNWIIFLGKQLHETFYIEFSVSKLVSFYRVNFYFKSDVDALHYRILKNDKVIQDNEKSLERVNYKVQKMYIEEPVKLYPERRYRFEYTFLNLTPDTTVRADNFQLDEKKVHSGENRLVTFTIFKSNSHIYNFYCKC